MKTKKINIKNFDLRELLDGISIKIKVKPRANYNKILGVCDDCLKISIISPPVECIANKACIDFFSNKCNIAKNNISIILGKKNRIKVIKIQGIDKKTFLRIFSFI